MSVLCLNNNYVDDAQALISHRDSGFTTGIGIFDSMLAKGNTLIHAREHFERIIHDSKIVIGLTPSFNFEEFEKICLALLEKNKITTHCARVRTTVTGGIVGAPLSPAQTPTFLIDVAEASSPENISPVKCVITPDFPRIAGCILENCKRLDYTRSYAARRKAEELGAEEAILTNTQGNITCGATSNIFIEENEILITPPLSDGVLAGVTRRKLIEEREVIEERISVERLHNADKIHLTNSFIGLRDVVLLN